MKRPFFSVIIPTYNRSDILANTVESLLMQSFLDWECVIVDDGSTDDTEQRFSTGLDPRFRYFKKENEERNIARNFGATKASSEWLIFLDSDDRFSSDHLQKLYELIQEKPDDRFIINPYVKIDEEGNELSRANMRFKGSLMNALAFQNFIPPSAVCIHKELFDPIQFIPSRRMLIGEDLLLWMQILARSKFLISGHIGVYVLVHEGQSMTLPPVEVILESYDAFEKHIRSDQEFMAEYADLLTEIRSSYFSLAALSAVLKKDKTKALQLLRESLKAGLKELFRKRNLAVIKRIVFN